MLEMSDEQLIDFWDMITEYIPKTNKEEAAHGFIRWCQDNGVEEDVLFALGDADPYLDEAVKDVQGVTDTDERYEEDDVEWSDDQEDDEW